MNLEAKHVREVLTEQLIELNQAVLDQISGGGGFPPYPKPPVDPKDQ
jgi:hypothetical protein